MSDDTGDSVDKEILGMLGAWTRSLVPELAQFIRQLEALEPDLGAIVAEHVNYYEEMLPTLLMGDIARWVTDVVRESGDPATRLRAFFDCLEDAWGDGQNNVSDLIATGFVENIYDVPEVVRLLGPRLTRYYRIYTGQDTVRDDEKRPMPEVMKQILKKLGRR
jgi:hypothetical protein